MYRIILLNVLLLSLGGRLFGQYHFPMDFAQSDSTTISRDLERFSGQMGVHFGHMPGVVFRLTRAFPRFQFFYQQGAAWTGSNTRYWSADEPAITTAGTFTGMADLTPNLQLMVRYNPMMIDGDLAVLNGFGARYRSGVGSDTLHTLAIGVLVQKLDGAHILKSNDLDFSLQYSRYYQSWVTSLDLTVSFVRGQMSDTRAAEFGSEFSGAFEHRVFHLGIKAMRSWNRINTGIAFRTNGRIWNCIAELGWSLPSSM
ncbi:MAG TPA: hypothetical protein VKA68_08530 [bacterium]|nr:hypothetical protein [bacterium]